MASPVQNGISESYNRRLLVTVGTTEFDQLIHVLDSRQFLDLLHKHHFSHIFVQLGRGSYDPKLLTSISSSSIRIDIIRFHPNLTEVMTDVDMIITHAGAGTVLEVLSLQKAFIVVVNPSLQDNHQMELANALRPSHYCKVAQPDGVLDAFDRVCTEGIGRLLVTNENDVFPIFKPELFAKTINQLMGFE